MSTNQSLEKQEERSVERRPGSEVELTEDRPVFVPATDIYEKEDAVLVRCDMPGVDQGSLDITLEDDVLTIIGSQAADAPEGHDQVHGEYATGLFRRSFTITQDIDHAKISAHIKNGVLDLHLPKAKQAQPRKIKVDVG